MTISELGVIGGNMIGTIANLEAIEVTIDPATYTSTPVSGGQTACLDSMSFTAVVEAP